MKQHAGRRMEFVFVRKDLWVRNVRKFVPKDITDQIVWRFVIATEDQISFVIQLMDASVNLASLEGIAKNHCWRRQRRKNLKVSLLYLCFISIY